MGKLHSLWKWNFPFWIMVGLQRKEYVSKGIVSSMNGEGLFGNNSATACRNGMASCTLARFILTSQSPPELTDALFLAERVHAALVQLSDGSSTFTGCDELGKPLLGNTHAYILCESNPCLNRGLDGEVTNVTVHVPAGFAPEDLNAVESLKEVWDIDLHIQLVLHGIGQPEDFGGPDILKGKSPILARSRSWISLTPFIPTRYPKATRAGVPKLDSSGLQIGSPGHDLRRLLSLGGLPDPVSVEPVSGIELAGKKVSWWEFHKERSFGDGRRAGNLGYGFRIEFPEPVQGPIAVGYGAHFGLGVFMPLQE
jgi:CRISPR-associated protein Csb2